MGGRTQLGIMYSDNAAEPVSASDLHPKRGKYPLTACIPPQHITWIILERNDAEGHRLDKMNAKDACVKTLSSNLKDNWSQLAPLSPVSPPGAN